MIDEIIIKNEDEAWSALEKALNNEVSDTAQVTFEGWPIFKLTIEGKDFNSTMPTRIMPPILELQKEIHRIYCRSRYNSASTRNLTAEDKEFLELIVEIKPGSSKYITKLFKALNKIIKHTNMTGPQAVTLLVTISGIIAGSMTWSDWIKTQERMHGQDITVELSKQETERLKLITQAQKQNPQIVHTQSAMNDFKNNISKKLKPDDQLKIDDKPVISGEYAAKIVANPRAVAEPARIDGEFIINEVKFPEKFGGSYRFSVTSVKDGLNLMVEATPDKLTKEQIIILKEGGFSVKTVMMQINAKKLRGNISGANLYSISWPSE